MFFPLVIQNTVKREASLVIQPQQVRFNAFFLLTWVIHTQISKNMQDMQKQLLIIYRMCTIELSGNSRKHIKWCLLLSVVQTSTWVFLQVALSSKSHSQRTCFSCLCSACPYWCNKMEFSSLMVVLPLQ